MTDPMPLLARARAAMPGLAELDAALNDVQARMAAAGARATSESDLVNAVAAEAVRSYTVPDDLGERLVKQRRVNEEVQAEIEALRRVQERLATAEHDHHRTRADAGLAVLAAELDTIIDAARDALDALGPDVRDADTAIAADRAGPWRQARALAERHAELRTAQRIIVSAALSPPRQGRVADDVTPEAALLVDLFGTVRDAAQHADVAAHLTVAAKTHAPRYIDGLISGQPVAVNQPPVPPWLVADPLEAFRFVTRRDVQAWVPTTVAELRAEQNEVTRRKSPDNEENPVTSSAEIEAAWRERGERSPRERGLIGGFHV